MVHRSLDLLCRDGAPRQHLSGWRRAGIVIIVRRYLHNHGGPFTVDCEVVGATGATGRAVPGGGGRFATTEVTSSVKDAVPSNDWRKADQSNSEEEELIL